MTAAFRLAPLMPAMYEAKMNKELPFVFSD